MLFESPNATGLSQESLEILKLLIGDHSEIPPMEEFNRRWDVCRQKFGAAACDELAKSMVSVVQNNHVVPGVTEPLPSDPTDGTINAFPDFNLCRSASA